ncbi:hypothetical protein F2Q69_00023285 [Brassica cretica]|uniref:Uncharacterized protein n=1 Tax=Brassica cretica TaxID=69181 RepID=A0A8S9Q8R6_BRACR|nr:hypothetical protein F2Q69_00023285 [Brassica cretica]
MSLRANLREDHRRRLTRMCLMLSMSFLYTILSMSLITSLYAADYQPQYAAEFQPQYAAEFQPQENPGLGQMWQAVRPTINPDPTLEE